MDDTIRWAFTSSISIQSPVLETGCALVLIASEATFWTLEQLIGICDSKSPRCLFQLGTCSIFYQIGSFTTLTLSILQNKGGFTCVTVRLVGTGLTVLIAVNAIALIIDILIR